MISFFNSISTRLAFKLTSFISIIVLSLALVFVFILGGIIVKQKTKELEMAAFTVSDSIVRQYKTNHYEQVPIPYYISFLVYSIDNSNGKINTISTNDGLLPPLPLTNGISKKYIQRDYFIDGDLNIIYFSKMFNTEIGDFIVETAISRDTDSGAHSVYILPNAIIVSIIPLLFISFFIGLFITKRAMSPVIKITNTAKTIETSKLDTLLPVSKSQNELDNLAETFNNLFKRIKADFDRERQFTSDVSHELKTPIAVILGQANMLRRWGKNDPIQLEKSLQTIINETKSMEAMITNLLQISRLESGRISPERTKVNINDLFLRIKDEVISIKESAIFNYDLKADFYVTADLELLHQVLMVVVSNSIKFVKESLVITANCKKESNSIIITLEDNGPGFGNENIPHVFERFYRGDSAHTRSVGGSGLGLSIAHAIIESMNGTIEAYEAKNGGAGIKITLEEAE